MNLSPSQWAELVFNVFYLGCVYWLVGAMVLRGLGSPADAPRRRRFRAAFLLLALGDTGHVGFRVVAFLLGGLETVVDLGDFKLSLVGAGALATAITVTLFYLILLDLWRVWFKKPFGILCAALIALALVRLILFFHPGNEWSNVVPPFGWSVIRNLPLTVLGLAVALLLWTSGRREGDRTSVKLSVCIFLSYAFYLPVVFLVQRIPAVGMLMIPKTLAYLAMAWIGLRELFPRKS